jgi:kynurenine formamidase
MIATFTLDGQTVTTDLSAGVSLGIAISEDGRHPRFYTDEAARFRPMKAGSFSGRVRQGGSCNVDVVEFIPHCHGTHTEGFGHVAESHDPVDASLNTALFSARLISVEPARVDDQGSPILSSRDLADHLDRDALIIRTLPNEPSKRERHYNQGPRFPILSEDAMGAIAAAGVQHLLIDTPSIDAADDPSLRLHRLFWHMPPGAPKPPAARQRATLTEMIFVPNEIEDGDYLLHLGLSTLVSDATPSCPTLFKLT